MEILLRSDKDRRLGAVSAELVGEHGRALVHETLRSDEWSLPATIHAIICAAPGKRPGRIVGWHLRWSAPIPPGEER